MGCHDFTEKQAHEPSSSTMIATTKRFKFLNDCNDVHHTSVPRKLRSAMKKSRCESMLHDSEKANHKMNGIESPKKDSIKKSRVSSSKRGIRPHWSQREGVSGPITKDEEEVVETLYVLAKMFPDCGSNDSSRELEGISIPKNSVLLNLEENANAAFEALGTAQDSSPCPERSPREASKIISLHESETIGQEHHDLPEGEKFLMASHCTTPTTNLQAIPMIVQSENSNKVTFHDSELCLAMGLNMPTQSRISHTERKPDVQFEADRDVDCKQEQHMIKDQKENEGLSLWPRLSPVASAGQDYLQSSATKTPDWMQPAICASKQDLMESCSSGGKISKVAIHKRSWKRCAAHVHISHIIRSLEVPKRQVIKEPELYECHQMRTHEGSKGGALLELPNLDGIRDGATSVPRTGHFAIVRNPHESKNGILHQQQCHYGVISQAATMPGVYGPQKQSFNILSLSAGNNMLKVDNSYNNKVGSRVEPLSKLQDPYLKLLARQHGLMPIPTPQTQYGSTSYLHQPSVAGPQVPLHQPHYYGSPLCGTHNSSTVSTNKQQQSFWAYN